jgi:Big-like domain-containing protein/concanavalin A-like lectin/glucanase superfamily protein/K319-like protein
MQRSTRFVVGSAVLIGLSTFVLSGSVGLSAVATSVPGFRPEVSPIGSAKRLSPVRPMTSLLDRLVRRPVFAANAAASSTNALRFDGSSGRVLFGTAGSPSTELATGSSGMFTVEVWFMREGLGRTVRTSFLPNPGIAAVPLVTKGLAEPGGGTNSVNYFLGIDANQVLAADFQDMTGANHPILGSTKLWPGVWYHAAAVYDGTNWQLFLNGMVEKQMSIGAFTPHSDSTQHAGFGAAFGSTGAFGMGSNGMFQGQLDEARIWNVARTQFEISDGMQAPLTSGTGLVGRFGFDEASGPAINSVNPTPAANGNLFGGALRISPGSPSAPSSSPDAYGLHLTGTPGANEYVDLGAGLAADKFTVETWFRREVGGFTISTGALSALPLVTKGRIEGEGNNTDINYFLGISSNTSIVPNVLSADFEDMPTGDPGDMGGNNHPLYGATPIELNTWYHGAVTYDGSTLTLYLNGQYENSIVVDKTPRSDSIERAAIGSALTSTGSASGFFNGTIDDVRIWNYARTPAQILSGRDREIADANGLLGHWNFDNWGGPIPGPTPTPTAFFTQDSGAPVGTFKGSNWMLVTGVSLPGAVNMAPIVSAGSDQSIRLPATAGLHGTVTDEGVPTTTWSMASGPGTVTFGDAAALSTTATFSAAGSYELTLTADDGELSASASVRIEVKDVGVPPVAVNDGFAVDEDGVLTVNAPGIVGNDTDADGDSFQATLVSLPGHGGLAFGTNGSFVYTPAPNYNGPDSFTYKDNDGSGDSNVATVSITVNKVNDAPSANNQTVVTNEDTDTAIVLTANDVDGDVLTYAIGSVPAHGTLSGAAPNLTYKPAANYNGTDSFTFKVNDGTVDSNVATVSITVNSINDAPVAANLSITTNANTATTVVLTGTDVDTASLTYAVKTGPAHGSLSGAAPNLTYTPAAGYSGPDSFTYVANDGQTDSALATVSIAIAAATTTGPKADSQTVTLKEDTLTLIKLTATDPKGRKLRYKVVQGPAHGAVLAGPLPWIVYSPEANYNGSDTFSFQVTAGSEVSNVAVVSLTITPVNDEPLASNLRFITARKTPLTGRLVGTDIDGDPLTYKLVDRAEKGYVKLDSATGAFTYTPNATAKGFDDFTYTVNDGTTNGNTARVRVEIVRPERDRRPLASNLQIELNRQAPFAGQLIASDDDGDDLTFALVTEPHWGSVTIGENGAFVYIPKASGRGKIDSFTFAVNDGDCDSNVATVRIDMTDNGPSDWR